MAKKDGQVDILLNSFPEGPGPFVTSMETAGIPPVGLRPLKAACLKRL